eukprot:TRINITY_DN1964_c5_g1_i1.p1 TRINITY_DN1964_c5_g1~~TRINITY_DN1964_c5_g1_i1.p1  ORF type:complete len:595 (-),score=230.43 TRINITY_DN1964_c5_g1_i1:82-1866(-)
MDRHSSSSNGHSKAGKPSFSMSLGGGSKKAAKRNSATAAPTSRPSAGMLIDHHDDSDGEAAPPKKEFIESLAEGAVQSLEEQQKAGPLVIPLAVNAWAEEPATAAAGAAAAGGAAGSKANGGSAPKGAKEKSLDELAAEELVKEADEERRQLQRNSRGTDAGLGLDSDRVIAMKVAAEQAAGTRKRGILEAAMIPGLNEVAGGDGAKLKHDLAIRAADIDAKSDVYRHVPVEEFGAALLRGMGWAGPAPEDKEGNANPLGTAEPRHHRLGLGAAPKPPEEKHGDRPRKRKPGEKANVRDEELRAAWAAKAAAASAAAARLTVGQVVELTATRRRAMVLKTQGVPGLGKIMVRLEQGGAEEAVSRTDVQLVPEDELALKPFTVVRGAPEPTSKRQRSAERSAERDGKRTSADAKDKKHKHKKKKRSRGDSRSPSRGSDGGGGNGAAAAMPVAQGGWLLESIRVRLVGRQFQKGADAQHYCKKGVSVNVSGDARLTDVRMDSGTLLRDVAQDDLETVLPSRGGAVVVVRGKWASQRGVLLAKGMASDHRSKAELPEGIAEVQLSSRHRGSASGSSSSGEVVRISFDDIAELASRQL